MATLNNAILWTAEVVLVAWNAVIGALAWIGEAIATVLNPLLSPALCWINPLCTWLGDAAYALLSPLPVWLGLTLISIVLGVVMLIAFRYTSNQTAIARAKDDIKANLLAMRLYRDELHVMFKAQLRIGWAILRLQRYVLTPVLIMLIPTILVLAQMGVRYQWRPLRVGERASIVLDLRDPQMKADAAGETILVVSPGMVNEAGPVPGGGRIVWRVRAGGAGRHQLRIRLGEQETTKEIVVSDQRERVSALRPDHRWVDQLLHPIEPPLPANSFARQISIDYPHVDSYVHGANWWVVYFFVISMLAALVLKPIFKVRF